MDYQCNFMKQIITCFILLCSLCFQRTNAQKKEIYFDYNWKESEPANARYYASIQKKDSLWYRYDYFIRESKLQMAGTYKDEKCEIPHGSFQYYHANGILESSGLYINGKKRGTWLFFYNDGNIKDSIPYVNGLVIGTALSWHKNGYLSDSTLLNETDTLLK